MNSNYGYDYPSLSSWLLGIIPYPEKSIGIHIHWSYPIKFVYFTKSRIISNNIMMPQIAHVYIIILPQIYIYIYIYPIRIIPHLNDTTRRKPCGRRNPPKQPWRSACATTKLGWHFESKIKDVITILGWLYPKNHHITIINHIIFHQFPSISINLHRFLSIFFPPRTKITRQNGWPPQAIRAVAAQPPGPVVPAGPPPPAPPVEVTEPRAAVKSVG